MPRDTMLAHFRDLVEATDLPVNADFENGYADEPDEVATNVRLCVATGVAGLSIEDSTQNEEEPLYDLEHAVARVEAARIAINETGGETILVARTECFLVGRTDIDEVTCRLRAFAETGADCLYAPGIRSREEITAVVQAVAPKPVNLLISAPGSLTMSDAAALGVRRVSVGGALARSAWGALMRAAGELAKNGRFDGFADAAPHGELNDFFLADAEPGRR
jgi:2-methylisocitrate lyase-like PEP mutase family enzyme